MKSVLLQGSSGTEVVAPLVGAWIEISHLFHSPRSAFVAPLVGAWIEISKAGTILGVEGVAPLVGAWIEIAISPGLSEADYCRSSCRSVD